MLKIVEVVVLICAGIGFAVWQFRDLRRAREITRQLDEAKQAQVVNACSASREPPLDGGSRDS